MKTFFKDFIAFLTSSIANMFTFTNLIFGCLSLLFVLRDHYFIAAIFIVLGTLIDRFDGMIARKLETTSDFGKELDSLADLVTFGVAPAFLLWALKLNEMLYLGSVIALIYIVAGAYRLARFNCTEQNGVYVGVPITIAGGFMAVFSLVVLRYDIRILFIITFMILISYAMISTRIKILKR